MRRNKRCPQGALGFETLESRLPLAGDVFIKVSNGNLTVSGDAKDNHISIVQTGPGSFTIHGFLGENFKQKGQPDTTADVFVTGVTQRITVNMNDGNDSATVVGMNKTTTLVEKNVTVNLGRGKDNTTVSDFKIGGKLTLTGKSGPSDFSALGAERVDVALGALLKAGAGCDPIEVQDSTFASLTIKTGNCPLPQGDSVFLRNDKVNGMVVITTGNGNDVVDAGNSTASKFSLKTGSGNDNVTIDNVTQSSAGLNLGAGNDNLKLLAGSLVLTGPAKTKALGGSGHDHVFGAGTLSTATKALLADADFTNSGFEEIFS